MDTPTLTWDEAKAIVDAKDAPKVTKASIETKIAKVRFIADETTTICIIVMGNGFKFLGTSTPASPENYDPEVGKTYAYDNAFKQIWSHEGYLLRDNLAAQPGLVEESVARIPVLE